MFICILYLELSLMFFFFFFFFNDTATTEIYTLLYTLSLHDALLICRQTTHDLMRLGGSGVVREKGRSEEHTSELQSHSNISYAVFCLKKKKKQHTKKKRNQARGEKQKKKTNPEI